MVLKMAGRSQDLALIAMCNSDNINPDRRPGDVRGSFLDALGLTYKAVLRAHIIKGTSILGAA